METKKKLLFLGFSYHEKTGSADFMIKLLGRQFDTTVCLVDLYADEPYADLGDHAGDYELLVCWHVMPPAHVLAAHFTWRHAALFPMADACPAISKADKWYPYRNFQIICFSRQLCDQLQGAGFSASHHQYFPKPQAVENWGDPQSAFFWFRRNEINGDGVARLIEPMPIQKLHILNEPDPGMELVKPPDNSTMELSQSGWFHDKADLTDKICESAIYVAPRGMEGIGMSFLEAMALGRCVVAPDATTMNEYIEHGMNGILYDPSSPQPIQNHDIRKLQENAAESIRKGHEKWLP